MERAYLQWNIPNWITVVLMASIGAIAVGTVASGLRRYRQNNGQA